MAHRRLGALLFSLGLISLLAPPLYAQSGKPTKADIERAADLFKKAEAYYAVSEYEKALEGYKEAYLLSLQPELIFNVAQCQRQLGRYEDAIKSYRSFLRQSPDTPTREKVETLLLTSVKHPGSRQ